MILPDWRLHELARKELVSPYIPENINPASVDLTLANEFVDLHSGERFVTPEIVLSPGDAVLASTIEYITMPPDCAGVLYLKSSLARDGLDHALAGFVDPGFEGCLTLELHTHREIILVAGQRLVQLVLYRMEGQPDIPYNGRYQGQRGPTEAR